MSSNYFLPPKNEGRTGLQFNISDWNFQDNVYEYCAKLYESNIFTGKNVFAIFPLIVQIGLQVGSYFSVDVFGNVKSYTNKVESSLTKNNSAIAGSVSIAQDIVCCGDIRVTNINTRTLVASSNCRIKGSLQYKGQIAAFLHVAGISHPLCRSITNTTLAFGSINIADFTGSVSVLVNFKVRFYQDMIILREINNQNGTDTMYANFTGTNITHIRLYFNGVVI